MNAQTSSSPAARALRSPRRALLAGLLAIPTCLAAGPAAAQDDAEPAEPVACAIGTGAPRIAIVADVGEFAYDHGRSMAALAGLKSTAQAGSGHMLGLTNQSFVIGDDTTKVVTLPQQDGSVCVGFTDGTITLRLRTSIFVVSEIAPGSCLYEQVLGHEERHAKVGRRLFTEFAETLEAGVKEALTEAPFIRVADPALAHIKARARLRQIIEPLFRDFRSVYRKRQAIIDTSGEYDRVEETCPGEIKRLTGQ